LAVAGGRTGAAGLPLGGIGGRVCADFPGGSGGGFTDLVFVSCGKFLAGGGGLCTDFTFDVWLGAGTYYLALQDVTSFLDNFLSFGRFGFDFGNPTAITMDGGVSWTERYGFDGAQGGVAVSVGGVVPEPATLALFATGLGLMALLAWRRSRLRHSPIYRAANVTVG
jgi:hypothetical protein